MIYINKHIDVFPGANTRDIVFETELDENLLNSMHKRYLDHPKDRSKLTCLIHGPGNSSDECNVLGDFGFKYSKIRTIKDYRQEPLYEKEI